MEYFSSQKVNCDRCQEKQHRDGAVTYSHSMLGAVLVHPDNREVFPMGCEAIQKQDGQSQNDWELNASKRLQNRLVRDYEDPPLVVVEDALYANEPHIEQLQANGWNFIINVKASSHKSLFEHFEARRGRGQVHTHIIEEGKVRHQFYWMNKVPLNGQGNVRINFLYYEEHRPHQKPLCFSWATSLGLRKSNVYEIMRGGRARWKIENETFNPDYSWGSLLRSQTARHSWASSSFDAHRIWGYGCASHSCGCPSLATILASHDDHPMNNPG